MKLDRHAEFFSYWPSHLYGEDTYGHLINFERIRDIKADCIHKLFDIESMLQHRAQLTERIQAEYVLACITTSYADCSRKFAVSKRLGRRIYKHIYILDLESLGMQHFTKAVLSFMKVRP